ncbi:hypothetical protein T11_1005, partial [Trichinella zimbabwensis]
LSMSSLVSNCDDVMRINRTATLDKLPFTLTLYSSIGNSISVALNTKQNHEPSPQCNKQVSSKEDAKSFLVICEMLRHLENIKLKSESSEKATKIENSSDSKQHEALLNESMKQLSILQRIFHQLGYLPRSLVQCGISFKMQRSSIKCGAENETNRQEENSSNEGKEGMK